MTNIHVCNCQFCEKNSVCLICGIRPVHRAHLMPRYLLALVVDGFSQKEKWLSFDSDNPNLVSLCKSHHQKFDTFRLDEFERQIILPLLADRLIEFWGALDITKSVERGFSRKIELYNNKLQKRYVNY